MRTDLGEAEGLVRHMQLCPHTCPYYHAWLDLVEEHLTGLIYPSVTKSILKYCVTHTKTYTNLR